MSVGEMAELRLGGETVARGECLAAFAGGEEPAQVYVVGDTGKIGVMFAEVVKGVAAFMGAGGVPRMARDLLLAAAVAAMAGPPQELDADPEPGAPARVTVELRRDDGTVLRQESPYAACALAQPGGKLALCVAGRPEATVAMVRALAATVSEQFGGSGVLVEQKRAAFLRELANAVLSPDTLVGGGQSDGWN